jgi:hypothetical protein
VEARLSHRIERLLELEEFHLGEIVSHVGEHDEMCPDLLS